MFKYILMEQMNLLKQLYSILQENKKVALLALSFDDCFKGLKFHHFQQKGNEQNINLLDNCVKNSLDLLGIYGIKNFK